TTARLRRELHAAAIERGRRSLPAQGHGGLPPDPPGAPRGPAFGTPEIGRPPETVGAGPPPPPPRPAGPSPGAPAGRAAEARGARVAVRVSGTGDAGPEMVGLASRIVSEALANAENHAAATSVAIVYTAGDERLELTVTDDGRGFDVAEVPGVEDGHLGLTV